MKISEEKRVFQKSERILNFEIGGEFGEFLLYPFPSQKLKKKSSFICLLYREKESFFDFFWKISRENIERKTLRKIS